MYIQSHNGFCCSLFHPSNSFWIIPPFELFTHFSLPFLFAQWKDSSLGQCIVSPIKRIPALGNLLYRIKEKKNIVWKDYGFGQSIVSKELIFENFFFEHFAGINFRELGFNKDFAGINFREFSLTKDFAGINFRKSALYKDFTGVYFKVCL